MGCEHPAQEFVAKLQELCENNSSLLLPTLQALSGLSLNSTLQVMKALQQPHGASLGKIMHDEPCVSALAEPGKGHGAEEDCVCASPGLACLAAVSHAACNAGRLSEGEQPS